MKKISSASLITFMALIISVAPFDITVNKSSYGKNEVNSGGASNSKTSISVSVNSASAFRSEIIKNLKRPKSKPSTKKSSSSTPRGGTASNNKYAKKSLSGDCKKVAGKCVVFSKSGCGNFYINGRHYGGSTSCRILRRNCPVNPPVNRRDPNPPRRPIGGTTTNNNTTNVNTDNTRPAPDCIPGINCPGDDGGPIINQASVNPIFANDKNQCTLNWLSIKPSNENVRVVCTIKSNGGATTTATSSPSMIPVGTTVLNCRREIKDDEDKWSLYDEDGREVGCRQNPNFIER